MPKKYVTRGDFDAECETCGWRCREQNALGVGVQHARRHGHKVRIEIVRAVIYDHTDTGETA